jgi:ribosomal 30S subunit maturation factor RimM
LEVHTSAGMKIVPFTEQFVGRVDLEARTIELKDDWVLQ